VIDVQDGLFKLPRPAHRARQVLRTIGGLVERARAAGTAIIFVQHDGGRGSALARSTPGWRIRPETGYRAGDTVVEKRTPDAFHGTDLDAILARLGVRELVVTGMQTEYCVDTTCRRASALNYRIVLVRDGHTTSSNPVLSASQIVAHHNHVLGDEFVAVRSARTVDLGPDAPDVRARGARRR